MTLTTRLLALAAAAVVAAVGVAVIRRDRPHPIARLIVLTRYSLLIAAVQFGLGVLALTDFPILKSAMENIFVLDHPSHVWHATWMSLLLATTCIVTYRTTKTSAYYRFADYRAAVDAHNTFFATLGDRPPWRHCVVHAILDTRLDRRNVWRKRWLYLAVLALPIPLAALRLTYEDLPAAAALEQKGELLTAGVCESSTLLQLVGWMLAGVVTWLAIMALAAHTQQAFVSQGFMDFGLFPLDSVRLISRRHIERLQPLNDILARMICKLGPGFCRLQNGEPQVLPGHGQLAVFTTIVVTAFVVSIFGWSSPEDLTLFGDNLGTRAYVFPTLVSVMTILLMFVLLVSGAAFLFDYWRFPIVLVILVVSLLSWKLTGADSLYEVKKSNEPVAPFAGRFQPPQDADGRRTLVIVTAAGGGIQASAWTTQVLTGLHEEFGDAFTNSIGLVSAVSGGSVGAMFYLDGLNSEHGGLGPKDNPRLKQIRLAGRRSSLEATAQVWSGWDLVKTLAPFLAPRTYDRGSAIEASWRLSLEEPDATMRGWGGRLEAGRFPIVVFNATEVETGKRLLISNAKLPEDRDMPAEGSETRRPYEYFQLGKQIDLNVATAARLSATFPYVSPICRADDEDAPQNHVADGGYVDNEGIFTALQWLDRLIPMRGGEQVSFDRVVILRIMPFPKGQDEQFPRLGWLYTFLGPLQAMMNVRSDSQVARNNFALDLMRQRCALAAEAPEGQPEGEPPFEIHVVRIQYLEGSSRPPLSWKLSQQQQLGVVQAWDKLRDEADDPGALDAGNPIALLGQWFERSAK